MKTIGLLGKKVEHSLSPNIHKYFIDCDYKLFSAATIDDAEKILNSNFDALNVTIPYKELAFKQATKLSTEASETGVCNLLIRNNNELIAHNTDVYGFEMLLNKNHIDIKGKNCLILGTGASSKTVSYVLKKLKAKSIKYLSMNKNGKNIFNYDELKHVKKTNIIINTTPIGSDELSDYCLIKETPPFKKLESYIDINYRYVLSQQGKLFKDSGIKCVNGLYMLVAQAVKSEELLQSKDFSSEIDKVYLDIFCKEFNIVLIGHPFSGKTFIGNKLAVKLNMNFIDTDQIIVEQENRCVFDIFVDCGERYFREKENRLINEISSKKGNVISLGGGTILNPDNMIDLEHNSIVINVIKDLNKIKDEELTGRPLIKTRNDLFNLVSIRKAIYKKYATFDINNKEISLVLDEIINNI